MPRNKIEVSGMEQLFAAVGASVDKVHTVQVKWQSGEMTSLTACHKLIAELSQILVTCATTAALFSAIKKLREGES